MPKADILGNKEVYKKPVGGYDMSDTNKSSCNCGCDNDHKNEYPCPPPPPVGYWCPPPEGFYPYPSLPVNPSVGSTEAQIAKLSKKSACIRKMIDNLVNKNKSIMISIGCGASYNFGCYLDKESEETDYGKAVLEMLQAELEAIKTKIVELTAELEVQDEATGEVEKTVTSL